MPKKKTRKIRALTIDEQRKLITAINNEPTQYGHQMLISMFTGMRMGEINALTFDDINTTFNFINIDKTTSRDMNGKAKVGSGPKTDTGERTVPINSMVKPIIDEILDFYEPCKDNLLFHSSVGGLISTNLVNGEFKKLMNKYRIQDLSLKGDVTLHSLRHTYATRCIESGMPPKVLQKLLGHKDITITLDTYSDVFENFQTESIEKSDKYMKNLGLEILA